MPRQFIVPQFIDKEDRIIGPITVRQFLICLVAAGLIFVEYKLLATAPFVIALLLTGGIAGAFGFLKVNGQPFHQFFVNFLQTQMRPKLRVWNKNISLGAAKQEVEKVVGLTAVEGHQRKPPPTSSRLRDLALTVNTGGVYRATENEPPPNKGTQNKQ